MTIVSQPTSLELSGNLPKFVIASAETFTFLLKKGQTVLLERSYDPGTAGQVEIDVRDIVEANLAFTLQDASASYVQTDIAATFTAEIGATNVTFKVIRAGVENFSDTAVNFLTANWLTWQPQIKKVSYFTPEFLTYYAVVASVVKCKAYFAFDNTTETITLESDAAGSAYTIPLQYALINSKLTKKLPGYFDVWVENATGDRLTYIQRFTASNKLSEDEQWILFENSLGGCDTARCYGMIGFNGQHTHNLAEIDEESQEYRVDTLRKYKKNTGSLDEYERRWLLDFFPSKGKFIYSDSAIRKIVVVESDVTYDSKDLPSSYTFTFQYATAKPFLNLTRSDTLPSEIVLAAPGVESFTLPPRLAELPRTSLTGGALIPFQSPYSETWGVMTLSSLIAYLNSDGAFPQQIIDAIYSLATEDFLSKTNPGTATKLIKFLEGIETVGFVSSTTGAKIAADGSAEFKTALIRELATLLKGIKIGDYQAGLTGAQIDENGAGEMDSLILRKFLEVPELRYNRISINVGDKWNSPGGGIIQSVDTFNKIITLKLEDGEIGAVSENDICMGIFHSTVTEENATTNADDSKGNRTFAGFYACYFRVVEILEVGNNSQFTYELRPVSDNYPVQHHPSAAMHFVGYGNLTNTARQTSKYETRTYERYLKGVNTWEQSVTNIAAQFGDLSNLTIHGLDMTGYSIYLNNIYMVGTIQQFSLAEPLRMEIGSSIGLMLGPTEVTNITIDVYKGWVNLTSSVTQWIWTRDSGNSVEDIAWNNSHTLWANDVNLSYDDLGDTINTPYSCLFTITAYYNGNGTIEPISQTILI